MAQNDSVEPPMHTHTHTHTRTHIHGAETALARLPMSLATSGCDRMMAARLSLCQRAAVGLSLAHCSHCRAVSVSAMPSSSFFFSLALLRCALPSLLRKRPERMCCCECLGTERARVVFSLSPFSNSPSGCLDRSCRSAEALRAYRS